MARRREIYETRTRAREEETMKIVVKHRPENEVERCDYRNAIQIDINGEEVFSVSDGEPEDSNLMRDFNDCYKIPDLLKRAFDAGKTGETFELDNIDEEDL